MAYIRHAEKSLSNPDRGLPIHSAPPRRSDVTILGGGPAGCATALMLCRLGGLSVHVVESGNYQQRAVGESIPPDTRTLLQRLGVWDDFVVDGHDTCYGSCSSWGSDELGYNDYLLNPNGTGWHLDRRRFNAFMGCQAAKAGAVVSKNTHFVGHGSRSDGYLLTLRCADGRATEVLSRFVVDATGVRAGFARSSGVRRQMLDQLVCVNGFFRFPDDADISGLTLLEAVESGWWYAARLPDQTAIAAFAGDASTVKGLGLRSKTRWLEWLRQSRHVSTSLARATLADEALKIRPAPSFVLDKLAGSRWLAVGDAASAYDPLSAQGIYKALATGIEAAGAIAKKIHANDHDAVSEYQLNVQTQFAEYREQREFFYQSEQRWPGSEFWARRQHRGAMHAN